MTLDVETPAPPELEASMDAGDHDAAVDTQEYRREDLEAHLEEGAWEQAFDEWAEHTDVGEAEFAVIEDLGLIRQFDFFWDDFVGRVGYHTPGIPEDWREREVHPDLDSWEMVSTINAGLAELGQVVGETLTEEYVDWDTDPDLPDDLPEYD